MLDNIKNTSIAIAKVTGKGVIKHIFFIGFSICLLIISIFLIGLSDGAGTPAAGHAGSTGAAAGIISLLITNFWATILFISSIAFIFLYFTLINKGIIHASLFHLWKENLEEWFLNKIKYFTDKYFSGGNKASEINDTATLKLRLINDIKNDEASSRWQRKIFSFLLNKMQVEEFDFDDPDLKISDYLALKATDYVDEIGEPSSTPLFILFGIQIILLVLALIF